MHPSVDVACNIFWTGACEMYGLNEPPFLLDEWFIFFIFIGWLLPMLSQDGVLFKLFVLAWTWKSCVSCVPMWYFFQMKPPSVFSQIWFACVHWFLHFSWTKVLRMQMDSCAPRTFLLDMPSSILLRSLSGKTFYVTLPVHLLLFIS